MIPLLEQVAAVKRGNPKVLEVMEIAVSVISIDHNPGCTAQPLSMEGCASWCAPLVGVSVPIATEGCDE